ncbi:MULTISPECIES: hypothetical protein [unclassified Dysgonomonas]|uniref:RCC1 domain-containing protein n=1 Tax=unclassified Dysgonomonas TaxID=2630389 RepID=UPI002473671E|nr:MULTISPECIES: hypothetical protein [unclassified Dysgonomonas]
MKYSNIIKLTFLLILVGFAVSGYAQIGMGIGTKKPLGILDVRPMTNPADSSSYGVVLPRVDTITDVINPQGGDPIAGTIAYDIAAGCIKFRRDTAWSDCVLNNEGLRSIISEKLSLGTDFKIKETSNGYNYTLAIGQDDNAIWVAGTNADCRTGLGRTAGRTGVFTLMFARPVVDVSAGYQHGIAAAMDGEVWIWGSNAGYRTGLGIATATTNVPSRVPGFGPGLVDDPYGKAIKVEAGEVASYILTESGKVYSAGAANRTGTNAIHQTFTWIPTLSDIVDISASHSNAAALNKDGEVFVWGTSTTGSLGVGAATGVTATPTKINFPSGAKISQIAMGHHTGIALDKEARKVYRWGNGNGVANPSGNLLVPTELTLILEDDEEIISIASQRFIYGTGSIVIVTTKDVYVTGQNNVGQLGIGNVANQRGLMTISRQGVYRGTKFTGASIGFNHTILTTGVNNINTSTSYVGFGMGSIAYRQLGSIVVQQRVPTVLTR